MPRSSAVVARQRLLDAALHRFVTNDVLAVTLEEVRREAGVSVGTLYHHFPDKPALAAAVYAQLVGRYQAGFLTSLFEQDTAEAGIRGGVLHHLRWVVEHRDETGLLLGHRFGSPALHRLNSEFFTRIRDWWRPHHAYGKLRPIQPVVTIALWLGPAQEYTRHWVATDQQQMPDTVLDTFATGAWQGLRADPTEAAQ